MVSYGSLLKDPRFFGIFATQVTTVFSTSVTGLSIGFLVNHETGSTFLTSLATFAPSLANAFGAFGFMSHADTRRPRQLMVLLQTCLAFTLCAQALPLPVPIRLALLLVGGVFTAVGAGIRLGLLQRIVPPQSYAPARSLLNLANGTIQVVGFALGSLLLRSVPRSMLFCALTVLLLLGAALLLITLPRDRVASNDADPADSVQRTFRVNGWAFREPNIRVFLLALWIPNGIVVGAESLFIPFGKSQAGLLLSAGAAGMLLGDLVSGRFLSRGERSRINFAQRIIMASLYIVFWFNPSVILACLAVLIGSTGFSASLYLQERLVRLTPPDRKGQIQGLESSGRVASQGIFALIAGGLAEVLGPGATMGLMGSLSLFAVLLIQPRIASVGRLVKWTPISH